jgi:integrase
MDDQNTLSTSPSKREPWNKGKFTGAKPPLRPKHVWSIRSKLEADGRKRDLAMFNLAIDSKLRACDVVTLKVEDIAPNGYAADRATIRQKKTGQPVRFEMTEHTRHAVDGYLRASGKRSGQCMFSSRQDADRSLTTRLCSARFGMDCWYWTGPACLYHSFASPNQGYTDLSTHGQSARRAIASWSQKDREHSSLSRH